MLIDAPFSMMSFFILFIHLTTRPTQLLSAAVIVLEVFQLVDLTYLNQLSKTLSLSVSQGVCVTTCDSKTLFLTFSFSACSCLFFSALHLPCTGSFLLSVYLHPHSPPPAHDVSLSNPLFILTKLPMYFNSDTCFIFQLMFMIFCPICKVKKNKFKWSSSSL